MLFRNCVALVALLSSCAHVPLKAPVLYPATMEVSWIDPHDLDCVAPSVKLEIARGMLRVDDQLARCRIDRKTDQVVSAATISDLNQKIAELSFKARMFDITLAAAIIAGIVAVTSTIIGIFK